MGKVIKKCALTSCKLEGLFKSDIDGKYYCMKHLPTRGVFKHESKESLVLFQNGYGCGQ